MDLPRKNRLSPLCLVFPWLIFSGLLVQAQPGPEKTCSFDPQPWLQDFAQLISEMSAHYANLEYAVEDRHMDLPALRREAETKLRASCSENEAKLALKMFLDHFGDGHLEIDWAKSPAETKEAKQPGATSLCERLGYEKRTFKPGIYFSELPQFNSLGGEGADWFPGGILRVNEAVQFGVIRIAIFSEHWFPEVCRQVVGEMHLADADNCDDNCENKVEIESGNRLTVAVEKRVAQLEAAGATNILVDVTQNGGGSDWIDPVVRTLSSAALRESTFGFIKHEHWTKELQDRLAEVEADLKQADSKQADATNHNQQREVLQDAATRLRQGVSLSQEKCDRNNVWNDGKFSCSLVVRGLFYVSGALPYAEPGSFPTLQSRTVLFHPLLYRYKESPARPPLSVIVDRQTWSSAEYFATILQDNGAAKILGEVTGGAGCGYTNGGIPTTLNNSHAQVKMPDCIRFRKDGTNENAGVTPDVLVPWSAHDSAYIKAQKLFLALSATLAGAKR